MSEFWPQSISWWDVFGQYLADVILKPFRLFHHQFSSDLPLAQFQRDGSWSDRLRLPIEGPIKLTSCSRDLNNWEGADCLDRSKRWEASLWVARLSGSLVGRIEPKFLFVEPIDLKLLVVWDPTQSRQADRLPRVPRLDDASGSEDDDGGDAVEEDDVAADNEVDHNVFDGLDGTWLHNVHRRPHLGNDR